MVSLWPIHFPPFLMSLSLSFVLRRKIGKFLDSSFYISILKIIISGVIMIGAILLIDYFLPWNTYANFKTRLIYLTCTIVVGAGVFFTSAYLLKSPEMPFAHEYAKKEVNPSLVLIQPIKSLTSTS